MPALLLACCCNKICKSALPGLCNNSGAVGPLFTTLKNGYESIEEEPQMTKLLPTRDPSIFRVIIGIDCAQCAELNLQIRLSRRIMFKLSAWVGDVNTMTVPIHVCSEVVCVPGASTRPFRYRARFKVTPWELEFISFDVRALRDTHFGSAAEDNR